MSPKDGPRNWDKELADIDKLIAANPVQPPPQVPAKPGARPAAAAAAPKAGASVFSTRRESIASVIWFLLAALLGTGLTFLWPYERGCGVGLYGYLASIGAFSLASLWSIIWSWRTRRAAVHFLSMVLLGWSAVLGAREILPRVGYARVRASWECRTSAAAPGAAQQVPPAQAPPQQQAPPTDQAPAPTTGQPPAPTPAQSPAQAPAPTPAQAPPSRPTPR